LVEIESRLYQTTLSAGALISNFMQKLSLMVVPLIVGTSFFMENLDGTIITTALPQIADSLGVNAVDMSAGLTSYLVTIAIFIPISGWVADRYGSQFVFGSAIGVFTLSSVLCGFCTSYQQFIFARLLQGLGGALMVPVGRLVVLRTTPKHELLKTIAFITWPGLVAPIIGPPLGGFITSYFSWRWIFYLNVPLGILGLYCVRRFIKNQVAESKRPLDWLGFILIGGCLATMLVGLEKIGQEQINAESIAYCAVSIVLGALSYWHCIRTEHPLLDFTILRIQTFYTTFLYGSVNRALVGTTPFLAPLMFQVAFGYSAFASGLLFLGAALGNLGLKPMTSSILKRFGFKNVLVYNGMICAGAALMCAFLSAQTSILVISVVMLIYGLSRSMQFTCFQVLAFVDVPEEKMSAANTLFSTVSQLCFGVGIALGALIVHSSMFFLDHTRANQADFTLTFAIISALIFAFLLGYAKLDPGAGAHVSLHQQGLKGEEATKA
jgi:EmrB/QacA subfamily drug resistance transporter